MKGVILAGGRATRLHPLTLVTNKHLLPVYDKPVIYYAIEKLISAGIDKIMIVTSPQHMEDFISLLGSGQNFRSKNTGKQIQIVYGIQNEPNGLAQGLCIAKEYVGNDSCVLHLGDNIFEDDITRHIQTFRDGALIFLKKVKDPERFGTPVFDKNNKIIFIKEKPKKPRSNLAVTGVYIYDNTVFKKMLDQKPSERGEYEITYINNKYIEEGCLRYNILKKDWFDVGTFNSLLQASNYMKEKEMKKKKK